MLGFSRSTALLAGVTAGLSFALWDWFFRPVGGGLDAVGYVVGRDFLPMWAAPRLAWASGIASLTDFPAFSATLSELVGVPRIAAIWSYPPTALLLLMPFGFPSYWASLALWTVAGWAVYLATASALHGSRPPAPALLLLVVSPAAWINMGTGQNGFIVAALLVGAFSNLRRRPWLAGVLFGLMTFKPHVGIALAVALAAIGAWRAIAAAVLTAALLALAATWTFGPQAWHAYATIATPYNMGVLAAPISGYRLLLVSLTSALTQVGFSVTAALAVQAAAAISVSATLWLAARRTADPIRLLALVAVATPLVSPYIWTYDLVALGAALALRFVADPGSCGRWILALGFLSPALSMLFQVFPGVPTAPCWLALTFAALVREAVERPGHEVARTMAHVRTARDHVLGHVRSIVSTVPG